MSFFRSYARRGAAGRGHARAGAAGAGSGGLLRAASPAPASAGTRSGTGSRTLRVSLGWSVSGQRRMPLESGLASGLIFTPLMTISRSSETGTRSASVSDDRLLGEVLHRDHEGELHLRALLAHQRAVLPVEHARELELVGDAEEEGEGLALGDEVEVGHAQEGAVLVERHAPGEERLPALVAHLQRERGVERLLGRGHDDLLGVEPRAADGDPHGSAVGAHVGRAPRLELRRRPALLEALEDLHRLACTTWSASKLVL